MKFRPISNARCSVLFFETQIATFPNTHTHTHTHTHNAIEIILQKTILGHI